MSAWGEHKAGPLSDEDIADIVAFIRTWQQGPSAEVEDYEIRVVEAPAPEMTEEEAADRLDSSHEPFVFYKDISTGRGAVLYRRYDGHYGVVEPRD